MAEEAAFRLPIIMLLGCLFAGLDHDEGLATWSGYLYLGAYVVLTPLALRRVATRSPRGDTWRAAAVLAYGVLPGLLLIPPHTIFSDWPGNLVVAPLAIITGAVAQIIAMREKPPLRTPAFRARMLAGGAVIYALAAAPLLGGAALGVMMGVWDPPAGAAVLSPLLMFVCLPLAIASGYVSLKLVREARAARRRHLAAAEVGPAPQPGA
jgi:hypothetical protein